jgi:hypothetical protein
MAEWEPIRRTGKPIAKEIHERLRRVEFHFPLSARPPTEWADHFESLHSMQSDYPLPKIAGDAIVVLVLQSQEALASWILNVDRDIEQANSYYMNVVAEKERQQEEAREALDEGRRQLEEAQRWADELEPPAS